jgi:hypothetical protein
MYPVSTIPATKTGNILLLQWVPFPIDKYLYVVVNGSHGYEMERGEKKLAAFTKTEYPDVSLAFTVVPGDADYVFMELDVPVIGVDAFRTDRYFNEYLDLIYTIHGFSSRVDLWAHLIRYQEAFWPVRDRITASYQQYLEEKIMEKQEQKPEAEDFEVKHQDDAEGTPA